MEARRYFGLDALRGLMMMLGILLHASICYLAAPPPTMPVPTDPRTSLLMDGVFHFIHAFRVPTFFVLSGFFTALLVEKRGLWGAAKNRAARVLAPLLVGFLTVVPLAGLLLVDFMLAARYGTHTLLPDRALLRDLSRNLAKAGVPTGQVGLLHLWFLYYLCYFYLLVPGCRWLVRRSLPYKVILGRWLAAPSSRLVFGLLTALTLWPFRGGQVVGAFVMLKPFPPALAYYGLFFVLGYLFRTYGEVLESFKTSLHWSAPLALVLFPLSLVASHLDYRALGHAAGFHLASVVVNALSTWALTACFLGAALRYFDQDSPWTRYLSQASYWVFLVHIPAVGLASWWFVPYDLPALVKFLGVVAFTTAVCFLSYHYLIQHSWVSVFLNGGRFHEAWPWQKRTL